MNAAVIDIGSNSVRLLIADYDGKHILAGERRLITTRLGRGVAENGMLDGTAMRDTLSALKDFKKRAQSRNCDKILAFATSAVREARNGRDFIHIIKENIGIDAEIISGYREAVLSFRGARAGLGLEGPALVIDIGGGSTEFCMGDDTAFKSISFPMGAVRLTQNYLTSDPPAAGEVRSAASAVDELLSGFPADRPHADRHLHMTAVGTGGTITTLAAVKQSLAVYDPSRIHGFCLEFKDVEDIFERFCRLTAEEKKKVPGLMPQRADIITAGVLILRQIMKNLGLFMIKVSESDLMEGYIMESLS